MKLDNGILDTTQKNIFTLLPIYSGYGYTRYKMSKFEEYDLYSKNKDFLVSDSVITFTDTNGKLMALKPDVTLSIVKNSDKAADSVEKLYYNENVYRVSKGTESFKEITQVGLECIGNVGNYEVGEVLLLAAESLKALSDRYVLEISHLGILCAFIDSVTPDYKLQKRIRAFANEKNLHSVTELCARNNVPAEKSDALIKLLSLSGGIKKVIPELEKLGADLDIESELSELKSVLAVFKDTDFEENILIDFSAVGDINYYNGVIFNGFIYGIPESVLTGGQYDTLMKKMKKNSRAVGFAVYLDLLERINEDADDFDVDIMLIYSADSDTAEISKAVAQFKNDGKSVFAASNANGRIRAKKTYTLEKGRVTLIENNA